MKSTIKILSILFLLIASTQFANAQEYEDDFNFEKQREKEEAYEEEIEKEDKFFEKDRLYLGGAFGFSFGSVVFLDLSPDVIYEIIEDRMQIGVGVSYQYTNYKSDVYRQYPGGNKFHSYGVRLYDRVFVWDNLFVQLEYQMVNTEYLFNDGISTVRSRGTFNTMFGGAGYNFMMGKNSFMTMLMSFNLNTNDYYPTRRPYFNLGFGIGL